MPARAGANGRSHVRELGKALGTASWRCVAKVLKTHLPPTQKFTLLGGLPREK